MLPETMATTQPVGWISDKRIHQIIGQGGCAIAYPPYEQPPGPKHVR